MFLHQVLMDFFFLTDGFMDVFICYLKTKYFRLKWIKFFLIEGRLAFLSVFRFKTLIFLLEQVFSANNRIVL